MTDAPAPRQDLAALARDVDRLFRARQEGRAGPSGDGYQSASGYAWRAAPEEAYAHRVLSAINGADVPDLRADVVERDRPKYMRTRAHVAALALLSPGFLAARLAGMDARRASLEGHYRDGLARVLGLLPGLRDREIRGLEAYMYMNLILVGTPETNRALVGQHVFDLAAGRPFALPPPPAPKKSDVARTHRHLVDLDRQLREWREAEARREAVATAGAQAAERDRKSAKVAADRADEMAAAEADGDLDCFEDAA